MIMTTNEILVMQNYLTKIVLKNGDSELSKDLKVKIMKMRIEMSKIRKAFDEDLKEFLNELLSDRFKELRDKPENERTEEEKKEFEQLIAKVNSDYEIYIRQRSQDEVTLNTCTFTEEEFNEILEVNSDIEAEINGVKMSAADILEAVYVLFVKFFMDIFTFI